MVREVILKLKENYRKKKTIAMQTNLNKKKQEQLLILEEIKKKNQLELEEANIIRIQEQQRL